MAKSISMNKKLLLVSFFLVFSLFLLFNIAVADDYIVFHNTGFDRASELKAIFLPDSRSWYWNHWNTSALGSAVQKTLKFNHRGAIRSTQISTKTCVGPRNNHDHKSTGTCNSYTWGTKTSSQCMGYADTIFDLMWDMDPMNGYFMYCCPTTDSVGFLEIPGVDYRGCELYNKQSGHTVILLDTSGSQLKVTDCNQEPFCKIRWNAYYKTKEEVSVKGSYFISPKPIIIEDSLCNWEPYEVTANVLYMRRGASSTNCGHVISGGMKKGTVFFIDAYRHFTNSKKETWAYSKTQDGHYGWVNISAGYCKSVKQTTTLNGPTHLILAVEDTFSPIDAFKTDIAECIILHGEGDVVTLDEDGLINAVSEGYAQVKIIDSQGLTAVFAITVLPTGELPIIIRTDTTQSSSVTSDIDASFIISFDCLGSGKTINSITWRSSDASVFSVNSQNANGRTCTIHALSNGNASLVAEYTVNMGNPYCTHSETWTSEIELTAIVPVAGELNCVVPAGSVKEKMEYLRQIFADGWYFTAWADNELSVNDVQYRIKVNGNEMETYTYNNAKYNRLGVSNKPCDHIGNHCSHYWGKWGGNKALGYARMMMALINNKDMETDAFMIPYDPASNNFDFLLSAQPGDVIAAGTDRYYVVQAVHGETFTVTDCNSDGHCGIRWDAQYTLSDFVYQILNYPKVNNDGSKVYIGRVYMPYSRPVPTGNIERYEVISSNGLPVRSQPYAAENSSADWGIMPKGTIVLADLKYVYSRDAGWALCQAENGSFYGWAQIGNTSLCRKIDDSDNLIFHNEINLLNDWCDIEPFQNILYENRLEGIISGAFSGLITSVNVEIKPTNPLTMETDEPVAYWGMNYEPNDSRITIDLINEVSFTDDMISSLTEGAYLLAVDIMYLHNQQVNTYHQQSVMWLMDENTFLPDRIEAQEDSIIAPQQTFYLTFRRADEPWPTLLYYSVDILEGDDVGEILCDTEEAPDYFAIDVLRKKEGTIRFNFTVMGINMMTITKTFTVTMPPCNHEMTTYWHDYPCTEPGAWNLYCCLCGEVLEEGYDAFNSHDWIVTDCTPATHTVDGEINDCYCDYCYHHYSNETTIISKQNILVLPTKLKIIEPESFMNTAAEQINIPENVTKIGSKAFSDCNALKLIVIPDSIVSIAEDAFDSNLITIIYCSNKNQYVINWAKTHGQPIYIIQE